MNNIDEYFSEISIKYYTNLVRTYVNRMEKANDKSYAHEQFFKYCHATLEFKFKISERSRIINDLEHDYKLGNSLSNAVKSLKKKYNKPIDNSGIISFTDENGIETFIEDESTEGKIDISSYSELELARVFADYIAHKKFSDYLLDKEKEQEKSQSGVSENEAEYSGNLKEFTTARQVLALHYLLKYLKVVNVDRTEVARFIYFLTSKSYTNIYKHLQNPLKLSDKHMKEDLKFIRKYFESLQIHEIVKMINDELNS